MKRLGLLIGCLTVMASLSALAAQAPRIVGEKVDKKKTDADKDEKKEPEKKDDDKKKPDPNLAAKPGYAHVYSAVKILSMNQDSSREITIELKEVDPKKVYAEQVWQLQQTQQLQRSWLEIYAQKDFKQRMNQMQNYQKATYNFMMEKAKRQNNIYTNRPLEVRAAEDVKVRSLPPPVEFDDLGNQKKWTKKELEERRDKTGLPGFPVELDVLKSGQIVDVYMAKKPAPPKAPMKKKAGDEDAPIIERPEFVMIVIREESGR